MQIKSAENTNLSLSILNNLYMSRPNPVSTIIYYADIFHRHYPIDHDKHYTVVMGSHRFEFAHLEDAKSAINDWYLTGATPCEIYECDRARG